MDTPEQDIELSDPAKLTRNPLVSVSIVTYNHAAFIREALDSILMQSVNFEYEICIGEDGSQDGTREICMEYAKAFPDKIRLFLRNRHNPERDGFEAPYMYNYSSTFNSCRGKYIALLDGDDCWLSPHKLQTQVAVLEANPGLGASCHYTNVVQEGSKLPGWIIPQVPVERFLVDELLKRDVENLHTSSWVMRKTVAMDWKPFRSSYFGDFPLFIWSTLQGTGHVLPRVWSMYRVHGNGVFGPLNDENRLKSNVELFRCIQIFVGDAARHSAQIGLGRTLIRYIAALRKNRKYRLAFSCFHRTILEVKATTLTKMDKCMLYLQALEALVVPRLAGLRRRMRNRWKA